MSPSVTYYVLQMGGMDKDTLTRTLERVSSLITDDAREGSAQPASSLSELPEIQSGALLALQCSTSPLEFFYPKSETHSQQMRNSSIGDYLAVEHCLQPLA